MGGDTTSVGVLLGLIIQLAFAFACSLLQMTSLACAIAAPPSPTVTVAPESRIPSVTVHHLRARATPVGTVSLVQVPATSAFGTRSGVALNASVLTGV